MTVQVELWQLISLVVSLMLAFLGFAFGAGRMLLSQIDRRLNERFEVMEKELQGWSGLERDFLKFQAALPLQYVRREDFVRNQTVIEAKLDALAIKIETLQLKGQK
ncbi:MAG: hypothetical protein H6R04_733 [Burkholderiaceae bacterium]|nr:hypothetical protein [Burkholderiaceae bacterium]